MSRKRGPLFLVAAAVCASSMPFCFATTQSAPQLFAKAPKGQPARPQLQAATAPFAPATRPLPLMAAPLQSMPAAPAFEQLQPARAGSNAPTLLSVEIEQVPARTHVINMFQLETERDFQALAASMQQTISPEAAEKQRAYEADFAAFPEAARGVRVKDFSCDDHNCIGQISAKHQEDIDEFIQTAGKSARYPIYTAQQVVVEDSTEALRSSSSLPCS